MIFKNLDFYTGDELKINGLVDDYVKFVANNQLKNKARWSQLIDPFRTKEDSDDNFWRGEFYGKEMRGAALVYQYTKDEELYGVLVGAVNELLDTADEKGRIATYTEQAEFNGWDMWSRKYVLTGTLHFYRVCKDEALKKRIISSLSRHLDYIISKIGDGEGQKNITETSSWWGCVNSCTILEPTLDLYKITGEKRYLKFAEYIVSTGGSSDCNFIDLALENKLYPYQYPVVKAYETMSFFEGLLAYYEITGEEKYLTAVKNFVEGVAKTDITAIGCAGCTHELFDNSAARQTEFSEQIMQETCVTVTWARLSTRLFVDLNDAKYIDRVEKSAFNALYGSINVNCSPILNLFSKKYVKGMTFDSYSPLYMNSRGRGTGGYQEFRNGGSCGCCDAIGACGTALVPLVSAMKIDGGVVINLLFDGEVSVKDKRGSSATLLLESGYPTENGGKITVKCSDSVDLDIYLRRPSEVENFKLDVDSVSADGYQLVSKRFNDGDEITVEFDVSLRVERLNGKVAFFYGLLTLAADEADLTRDIEKPISVGDNPLYRLIKPQKGGFIEVEVQLDDGDTLLLKDYQSVGKNYGAKKNRITTWFNS